MASVFLSYDRDDADRARAIATAFEKAGHSVWWDLHVRGGAQFGKVIEEALKAADAVVVLWSSHSVESSWVKDEATAGRDSGRLVPVTIDGTEPPMGFRQFQTIDLSRWTGRGKPIELRTLLTDVETMTSSAVARVQLTEPPTASVSPRSNTWRPVLSLVGVFALLLALGAGARMWFGRGALPIVEVTTANASPQSQVIASDLFAKLGGLAQIGGGKWQLVEASSAPKSADLIFRTADTSSAGKQQANLLLLDGKDDVLLWSREFSYGAGAEADLRQQLALTAGRVLGCALESHSAGGLSPDLLKLFLNACALLAESSAGDPNTVSGLLRTIVSKEPRFTPAWSRLIAADVNSLDFATYETNDFRLAIATLRGDIAKARSVAPDLPELAIAEAKLLPPTHYAENLHLLEKAASRAPNSSQIFTDQALALERVGRMDDAVAAARRAAQLDPLSPAIDTQLIMTLAYAGQLDSARQELARAEKAWAGTAALRDALFAFHLRYGDPNLARRYADENWKGMDLYLEARANPSPANVQRIADFVRLFEAHPTSDQMVFASQALAEVGQIDAVFEWFDRMPPSVIARESYVFFRPAFGGVQKDPRFMQFAKRIGLVDYWRASGMWPDFCKSPIVRYDCKRVAAELSSRSS
jgi:tetratricopeptide (TPR) repeat protein